MSAGVAEMSKQKRISHGLTAATCALLGSVSSPVNAEGNLQVVEPWEFKAAILSYSEQDRVSAIEPVIEAKKWLDTDETLTLKLVLDSLTGASPTGAVPSDIAHTTTSSSGSGTITTNANDLPLDENFKDTRVAVGAAWDTPLSRMNRLTLSDDMMYRSKTE